VYRKITLIHRAISLTETDSLIQSTIWCRNSWWFKIFQIARSEHMPAEGDPVAGTSTNQTVKFPPVPVAPMMMKEREECKMLQKAFTILTSSAAAAASADNECLSLSTFIANKLWNYFSHKRYYIRCSPGAINFCNLSPASQVVSPTIPFSVAASKDTILSDQMCLYVV